MGSLNAATIADSRCLNVNKVDVFNEINLPHTGALNTVNLSSYTLSASDRSILDKGLTFIPTPKFLPVKTLIESKNNLIKSIKLKSFFRDSKKIFDPKVKTFKEKSTWTPGLSLLPVDIIKTVKSIENCTVDKLKSVEKVTRKNGINVVLKDKSNISGLERLSISNLKNNSEIVIKKADKGSATVIMDLSDYCIEADRQLSNASFYKPLKEPIYPSNRTKIRNILSKMKNDGFIDKAQFDFLAGPEDPRPRIFYLLPKIHKSPEKWTIPNKMPEGRPIVSDTNSESQRVSQFIDASIAPLSTLHPTYLKNTYDFVSKIRNKIVPANSFIVTGDVTALYTNMKHDRTLECIRGMFHKFPVFRRPDHYLLELLELTLKNNDFKFDDKWFLQVCGAPMGKAYSPSLANIYMLDFDELAMNGFRIAPLLFFRFLDDIFFIWVGSVEELLEYENYLNGLIPGIKVTLQYDPVQTNFLDCTIYKRGETDGSFTLQTRVYFKATDSHQLLHKSSYHPRHTFNGVLKSQLVRFRRISSSWEDYFTTSKILFRSLKSRGYTFSSWWNLLKRVWFDAEVGPSITVVKADKKLDSNLLPIVVKFDSLGREIVGDFRKIVQENAFLANFKIVNAFSNHDNLYRLLVRSDLSRTPHTLLPGGGRKLDGPGVGRFDLCNSINCLTCKNHARYTKTVTSTAYGTVHSIEGMLSCKTLGIVYLITCKICRLQYVGETGRNLTARLINHRSDIKNGVNTAISVHFNGHPKPFEPKFMEAIAIEKVGGNDDMGTKRRKRETFWQNKLGTGFPLGLNNYPLEP